VKYHQYNEMSFLLYYFKYVFLGDGLKIIMNSGLSGFSFIKYYPGTSLSGFSTDDFSFQEQYLET